MIVGYVRHHARFPASTQTTALEAAGAERVWTEGEDETLDDLIRQLRKGDVVAVYRLHLLAPPKRQGKVRPQRSMLARLQEIEARAKHVLEAQSGRSTATPADRDAILADNNDYLSGAPRGKTGHVAGRGRQTTKFSEAEIAAARAVWTSRKVKTWEAAKPLLPKGFTVYRAFKMFGPRDGAE